MAKRKARPPEPERMVAAIESVAQTYYISELSGEVRQVEDEATLEIVGRIERLDRSRSQYLGQQIDISLLCARSSAERRPRPLRASLF